MLLSQKGRREWPGLAATSPPVQHTFSLNVLPASEHGLANALHAACHGAEARLRFATELVSNEVAFNRQPRVQPVRFGSSEVAARYVQAQTRNSGAPRPPAPKTTKNSRRSRFASDNGETVGLAPASQEFAC